MVKQKLKKDKTKSEMETFQTKFKGRKPISVTSDAMGKIIEIESSDPEVIAYAKKLGLMQDGS